MTRIHFILFPCNPCRPYLKNHQIHFDATPFTGAALPFYLFSPCAFKYSLALLKCLFPKKPLYAEREKGGRMSIPGACCDL